MARGVDKPDTSDYNVRNFTLCHSLGKFTTMAKDYAKRTNRRQDWYSSKPKARSHSNVWVLLIGLVMGFMVAAVFYMLQQPNSMLHKASLAFLQKSAKSHEAEESKPAAKTTVMAAKKAGAPHFDFYTILPKEQVPTTKEQDANQTVMAAIKRSNDKNDDNSKAQNGDAEEEIFANLTQEQVAKKAKSEEVAAADDNDEGQEKIAPKYILQIGKFAKYADADELRAQLVMMGFVETNIKTIHRDGESISRVWLGPFSSMASAQKIQQQLAENQIKSMVMKDS